MSDYIIGKPLRSSAWSYTRRDTYIPTGSTDLVHVAHSQDTSPLYSHWQPGKYDPRCSCCYLGFAHSEAKHQSGIDNPSN